ncbi:LCP family protein [Ligilactobacillus hohenheimensis]|uniref:LCP family protein n=1 Tax=Ligilactobacillus hohenheimensis TaxID=2991832 RepID=UPI0024BBE0B5|nr:LCP family protein [Ligilactobacillus hohenheimensis]
MASRRTQHNDSEFNPHQQRRRQIGYPFEDDGQHGYYDANESRDPYPLTPEEEEKGYVGDALPSQHRRSRRTATGATSDRQEKRRRRFFWALLAAVIALAYGCFFFYNRFEYAHQESNLMFQATGMQKERNVSKMLKEGKPVSVLLMGTDTGALGRDFKGRTDTMIVCVMNPKKKTMTLVSIPRDTLVAIYKHEDDYPSKINAAYQYGSSYTAVKTVQRYLNIPIDFYATINMGGLESLIKAVGGVTVKPTLTFSYGGYHFTKGKKTHMSAKKTLAYVRMRHQDPLGDYGRQDRQRQVLMKLAFKGSDLTSLINQNFMKTVSKQMRTDLTFDDLLILGSKYRVATHHMKSTHLQGHTEVIGGEDYEVPGHSEKQRITNIIRSALGLKHAKTGTTLAGTSTEEGYEREIKDSGTPYGSTETNTYDSQAADQGLGTGHAAPAVYGAQ